MLDSNQRAFWEQIYSLSVSATHPTIRLVISYWWIYQESNLSSLLYEGSAKAILPYIHCLVQPTGIEPVLSFDPPYQDGA